MSLKILGAIFVILAGSAAAEADETSSVFLESTNLLENPGFESVAENGMPLGWHPPESAEAHGSDSAGGRSPDGGRHSVTIVKGPRKRWASWWQDVQVTGDRRYRIGGWIKVKGECLVSVAIHFYGRGDRRLGIGGVGHKGDTDWMEASKTVTAPRGTTRGRLHCAVLHEGQAWFDDIELVPTDNPVRRPLAESSFYPARATDRPIKIDGKAADWKGVLRVRIGASEHLVGEERAYEIEDQWRGPADLSADFALTWDASRLYLCVEATDDRFPVAGPHYWEGDSVQFAVDCGNEKTDEPDGNDCEVGLGLGQNSAETVLDFAPQDGRLRRHHVQTAVRPTEKGYVVETAVPWKRLGIDQPARRSAVGFSLLVNDNDGDGRKWLEWTAGIGHAKVPARYGTVALLPAGKKVHARFDAKARKLPRSGPAAVPLHVIVLSDPGETVTLALTLKRDGRPVAEYSPELKLTPGAWRYDVGLDTPRLQPADYSLEAALTGPDKEALAADTARISVSD